MPKAYAKKKEEVFEGEEKGKFYLKHKREEEKPGKVEEISKGTDELAGEKEQKMRERLRSELEKTMLSSMARDFVALSAASTWANKTEVVEYKPQSFAYSEEIRGSIQEINKALASAQCVAAWDVSEGTLKVINLPIMASKELGVKPEEIKQADQYHYKAKIDYERVSSERMDELNKRLTLLNTGYLVNVEKDKLEISCFFKELERKEIEKRHAEEITAILTELIISGEESADILFSMSSDERSKVTELLEMYGFTLEMDFEEGTLRIRKKRRVGKKRDEKKRRSKGE